MQEEHLPLNELGVASPEKVDIHHRKETASSAGLLIGWLVGGLGLLAFVAAPPATSAILLLLPLTLSIIVADLLRNRPIHCAAFLVLTTLAGPIAQIEIAGRVPDIFLSDFFLGAWLFFHTIRQRPALEGGERLAIRSQWLFFAVACISTAFGGSRPLSTIVTLKTLLTGVLVLSLMARSIRRQSDLTTMSRTYAAFASVLGILLIVSLLMAAGTRSIWAILELDKNSAAISFGKSNYIGGFFALLLPICGISAKRLDGSRLLGLTAVLLTVMGLIICNSQGALTALVLALAGWLVIYRSRGWGAIAVAALGVGITILLVPASYTQDVLLQRFTDVNERNVLRVMLYQFAWNTFLEHPVMGIGIDGLKPRLADATDRPDDINTHNFVLETMAETGIVGLILYTVPIGLALSRGFKVARGRGPQNSRYLVAGLTVGFLGSTAHGLLEVLHRGPQYTILYWSIAGCLIAAPRILQGPATIAPLRGH